MNSQVVLILVVALLGVSFLPIYFQNRKIRRYASEDLKQIDIDEWAKQLRWDAYSRLIGRLVCGAILLGIFFNSLRYMTGPGLGLLQVFTLLTSLGFFVYGYLRLRRDRSTFIELE